MSSVSPTSIIKTFEDHFEGNDAMLLVFNDFRSNLLYVAPERLAYVFWNGTLSWRGLTALLCEYCPKNEVCFKLFTSAVESFKAQGSTF